jgi:hypothetical protein
MMDGWSETVKRIHKRLFAVRWVVIFLCCNASQIESAEAAPLRGTDVIVIGTTIDTLVRSLMVHPEIERTE